MERLKPETFAKEMQGDPSSGSLETISRDDFRAWRIEEGQVVLFGRDGEVLHRWSLKDCRAAVGIQGLPKASGVYECIVEEWVSDVRREFRVRDYWSVRT